MSDADGRSADLYESRKERDDERAGTGIPQRVA